MDCEKPLRLPIKILAMLRGEVPYTEEVKDLAELCIYAYQCGKAGWPYAPVEKDIAFPNWVCEALDMLLRAAHKHGRVDAGLEQHTSRTAPVRFVDLEVT